MSREDKVLCQCCKRMMVPRVVVSRGVLIMPIRLGEGVTHNICPFCLSEHWETGKTFTAFQRFFHSDFAWFLTLIAWFAMLASSVSLMVKLLIPTLSSNVFLWVLAGCIVLSVFLASRTCRLLGGK